MATSDPLTQVEMIRVHSTPDSVLMVRGTMVDDLTDRGILEEAIDEAEIVVSELFTNALRHGSPLGDGTIRVRWKVRFEVVEIEVTDGGSDTVPTPAPRAVWAPSGRGLRIVRALAHEWGVSDDKLGRTVWAALGGPSRRRAT